MRFSLPVLWLLLGGAATAADLRGVSHGAPCIDISEIERGNGAVAIEGASEARGFYAFVFEFEDKTGYVAYSCSSGIVGSQFVVLPANSREEANAILEKQFLILSRKLGEPCIDWRNLSFWRRATLWLKGVYDSEFLNSVEWNLGKDASGMLSLDGPAVDRDYWSVMLSISGRTSITRLNPDGSETLLEGPTQCVNKP